MLHSKSRWFGTMGKIVGALLAVGVLAGGFLLLMPPRHRDGSAMASDGKRSLSELREENGRLIVDGVLETDSVDISSKLPGRLAAVYVNEGDTVRAGQVLALLQAEELDAKQEQAMAGMRGAEEQVAQGQYAVELEQNKAGGQIRQAQAGVEAARASLNMARAKLAALEKGARPQEIEQAQQAVNAAEAAHRTAKKTYDRIKNLAEEGLVAQQKADEAEMAYQSAEAQLNAARAKLSLVKEGTRTEEIDAARAQVSQAAAGVDAAEQTLQLARDGKTMVEIRRKDVAAARQKVAAGRGAVNEVAAYQRQTRIVSPISGQVTQRMSRGGEIVAPGYAIMTIARTDSYWVDVYVDETKFAGHRVGEQVQVEIPAAGKTVPGVISKLLPAADFATKRATNEKGAFDIRAVQLRVTLRGDVRELATGLTAHVRFTAGGR